MESNRRANPKRRHGALEMYDADMVDQHKGRKQASTKIRNGFPHQHEQKTT